MWTSVLDRAKEAAKAAQEAAEQIENQLNDSVGVPAGSAINPLPPAVGGPGSPDSIVSSPSVSSPLGLFAPESDTGMLTAGSGDDSDISETGGGHDMPTSASRSTTDSGFNDSDGSHSNEQHQQLLYQGKEEQESSLIPPNSGQLAEGGSKQEVSGDGEFAATAIGIVEASAAETGGINGSQQQQQQEQYQRSPAPEEKDLIGTGEGWDDGSVSDVEDVSLQNGNPPNSEEMNCEFSSSDPGVANQPNVAFNGPSSNGKVDDQDAQEENQAEVHDNRHSVLVAPVPPEEDAKLNEKGEHTTNTQSTAETNDVVKFRQEDYQHGNNYIGAAALSEDQEEEEEEAPLAADLTSSSIVQPDHQIGKERTASSSAIQSQIEELELTLSQREEQLKGKAEQLTSMQEMFDREREELRNKIRETKEEAKRRIGKARERVDAAEKELLVSNSRLQAAGSDDSEKDEIIAALRSEGESLMRKQSQMEQSVRTARGEVRDLTQELSDERSAKEKALGTISDLEKRLKLSNEELAGARKGETRAGKLGVDLANLREESEKKANTILALEQQVKELKDTNSSLKEDVESARKAAMAEKERESSDLKRERDDMLSDLETKLRSSEREAAVREDALRHEVGELRKRWQDAVRRADEMRMDYQQSTAPLMRQLESTERQHRARAAAWAELEMKLRHDLEETVSQNEKLVKELSQLRTNLSRLERRFASTNEELVKAQDKIKERDAVLHQLEAEAEALKEENAKARKLSSEAVAEADEFVVKIRSEMTKTLLFSEERCKAQVEALEREIREEREVKMSLESKLNDLAQSTVTKPLHNSWRGSSPESTKREELKKLQSTTEQADILQNALADFEDSDNEDDESSAEQVDNETSGEAPRAGERRSNSSFAAMEQLSQGMKGARLELDALRKQLTASEETRESLMVELAEARAAFDKLSLFEAKVSELTREVDEKDLELQNLQEDIVEVRLMYRRQLDELLEEKAANNAAIAVPGTNEPDENSHNDGGKVDDIVPSSHVLPRD